MGRLIRWPVAKMVGLVLGKGCEAPPVLAGQAWWLEGWVTCVGQKGSVTRLRGNVEVGLFLGVPGS